MDDSDSQSIAESLSAEPLPSEASADGTAHTENPSLGPLEGGRWRSPTPEALQKRQPSPKSDEGEAAGDGQVGRVRLERRQELEHKLKSNPTDLDGFLELAQIYRDEDRPLEAKRLLKQASEVFPEDETVQFQLEEATLARSLQQFRQVSELATRLRTPEAHRELERSRHDWACRRIEVCRSRLERDPSQLGLRLTMAEAKYDAELFEDAFADAGRLVEMDEYAPQAYFLRARCLLAMGKEMPAMKELRAVALRRAVPPPPKLRLTCLKMLTELADKLNFAESGKLYREYLRHAEQAVAAATSTGNSPSNPSSPS
jgi:hypothetical protein